MSIVALIYSERYMENEIVDTKYYLRISSQIFTRQSAPQDTNIFALYLFMSIRYTGK